MTAKARRRFNQSTGRPARPEQNLIVRIGKSEAEVTDNKRLDCARGIVLLKLTTLQTDTKLRAASLRQQSYLSHDMNSISLNRNIANCEKKLANLFFDFGVIPQMLSTQRTTIVNNRFRRSQSVDNSCSLTRSRTGGRIFEYILLAHFKTSVSCRR